LFIAGSCPLQHLITQAADEIWCVNDKGQVHPWRGSFQQYKESLIAQGQAAKA
jgi:hypothetical protein